MKLLEGLKWRYATKKFDNTKKISDSNLEKIKEAIQLSASSYGLQLYKVLIVEDKAVREKLKPAAWGQGQITDASHLFIFCNYSDVNREGIDEFVHLKAKTQGIDAEALKPYGDFIESKWTDKSSEEKSNWTAKQSYIALGNLLAACGELEIDSCPMEGFEAEQIDEILGLKEKGLTTAVLAAVGYRAKDDETAMQEKVRKPKEILFETI
jgi:nitroreductase